MSGTLRGQLYLDGRYVGDVAIRGWHGAWGIGEFAPRPAFLAFAPLFAEWSRLMHADDRQRLSPENAARLRRLEFQTYALRAALWIVPLRHWRSIDILNIDGSMIEWKEGWSASDAPPPPSADCACPLPSADAQASQASPGTPPQSSEWYLG